MILVITTNQANHDLEPPNALLFFNSLIHTHITDNKSEYIDNYPNLSQLVSANFHSIETNPNDMRYSDVHELNSKGKFPYHHLTCLVIDLYNNQDILVLLDKMHENQNQQGDLDMDSGMHKEEGCKSHPRRTTMLAYL
jgi:hypothetical protein